MFLVAFAAFASHVSSQSPDAEVTTPHDLVVHIDGLSNDTIYLANYYGAKLFYNDTAVTDANGTVTLQGSHLQRAANMPWCCPVPSF